MCTCVGCAGVVLFLALFVCLYFSWCVVCCCRNVVSSPCSCLHRFGLLYDGRVRGLEW